MGNAAEISFVQLDEEIESDVGKDSPGETHHIAFRCESRNQIKALHRQIKDAGVAISPIVDHGICASAYFEDPDGVQLEITYTQRPYEDNDYDLSLLDRVPAPEEDLFHTQHKEFKAQQSATKRRALKSRL